MMKLTQFTVGKGDIRYVILGILFALTLVVMLAIAAQAKAKQLASVRVIQNGELVYENDDYFGPDDFFSHYNNVMDDIFDNSYSPFDQIKELSNTPEEFKTVIENENGSKTTIEHSNNNGEIKTVVESNHRYHDSPNPTPTVSTSPGGIEIDNGHGTCVKKQGGTTIVEAPNVKVNISGTNGSGDNDIDIDSEIDIRRDDNREKTECDYDSDDDN